VSTADRWASQNAYGTLPGIADPDRSSAGAGQFDFELLVKFSQKVLVGPFPQVTPGKECVHPREVDMVGSGRDQVPQGAVQQVKEQVQEKTRLVTDVAGAVVGDRVRSEIDARSSKMAVEAKAFSQAMSEASRALQEQGHDAQADFVQDMAGRADRLAAYLVRADAKRLLADGKKWGQQASELARNDPLLATAAAFTLGLLATRWLGNDNS
jgi:hypothetical protein